MAAILLVTSYIIVITTVSWYLQSDYRWYKKRGIREVKNPIAWVVPKDTVDSKQFTFQMYDAPIVYRRITARSCDLPVGDYTQEQLGKIEISTFGKR